jgi:hypothetical protein
VIKVPKIFTKMDILKSEIQNKRGPKMVNLQYLDDLVEGDLEFKEELLWWQKEGLSFTSSGFGRRIPTTKKVLYRKRWYRVYCHIFSNVGSCYIESNRCNLYIR